MFAGASKAASAAEKISWGSGGRCKPSMCVCVCVLCVGGGGGGVEPPKPPSGSAPDLLTLKKVQSF